VTNLAKILQVLQEFQPNGKMHAQLPDGVAGIFSGQIVVSFHNGQANACYIMNGQGQIVLAGNNAMQLAYNIGTLDWVIEETLPQTGPIQMGPIQTGPITNPSLHAVRPASRTTSQHLPAIRQMNTLPPQQSISRNLPALNPTNTFSTQRILLSQLYQCVPQRCVQLDVMALNSLPRQSRRVFMLIDGARTIGQIAALLFSPANGIYEALAVLQELKGHGLIIFDK
jgi:hypothetical protein